MSFLSERTPKRYPPRRARNNCSGGIEPFFSIVYKKKSIFKQDGSAELEQISRGAYLHDLGKIAIPDAILFKKGKLSAQEWNVMRTHAWIGFNLINRITLLAPAAEVLLTHHERYDGTGYPRGLKGDHPIRSSGPSGQGNWRRP